MIKKTTQLLEMFNNNYAFQDMISFSDGAMSIAFSKGVLQLHKGELSAVHENDKTSIIISLPSGSSHIDMESLEKPSEEMVTTSPSIDIDKLAEDTSFWEDEDENGKKKHLRMLLVEYNHEMIELFKESFSLMYDVIDIQDAEAAYELAVRETPDIILCETHLPGISGTGLCSMLKTNVKTDHIPIILLSSQPSEEQTIESIRCGADHYFVKPFNIKELFLRCNYLIKSRRKILKHVSAENNIEIIEMATNEQEQEFLASANQVVEENWGNPDFDTQLWSSELNISRTRFFNLIKKTTGMTPNDYLISLKMNKARTLLQHKNNSTISEIAYELGFNNPAYFSKCFKRQFGVTPQEYRKPHTINNYLKKHS